MKRVLILSYYFPPCGGAGVQRWLRFTRYLPEYGWLPTVLTAQKEDYPTLDYSLSRRVHNSVKIIRTSKSVTSRLFSLVKSGNKGSYPYGTLQSSKDDPLTKRLLYWARLNLISPDSRIFWNKQAYLTALRELRSKKYDLIVTTGPPHSTHLIGLKLKETISIKWVADFRDPWTEIYYLQNSKQNRLVKKYNRTLEKKVLQTADRSLIISEAIADALPAGNKQVLTNGYDPDDFSAVEEVKSPFFRIKYVGSVTDGQDLKTPLNRLNQLCFENGKMKIEVSLVGAHSLSLELERAFPFLHLRSTGYVSHQKAVNEMVNSELLLLLINRCTFNQGILTTKLFEYIAAGNYVLGIGNPEGEAAGILRDYQAGLMIDYDDSESFRIAVQAKYQLWSRGELRKNSYDTSPLSAPKQTKELTEIFDSML